jgi:hypothetical protein
VLGIKFPDLRGVQRPEIWGIVVICCFNLALLAIAIRYGGLGQTLILLLVAAAQACSAVVISLLLRVRLGRDQMDDMRKIQESMAANTKDLRELSELLTKQMKELEGRSLPCLKNLPPQ